MAKPIVLVKYNLIELNYSGTNISLLEIQQLMDKKFEEYNVLCVPIQNPEEFVPLFDLQVFHEKDFTDIQYQELKELIEKEIKSLK